MKKPYSILGLWKQRKEITDKLVQESYLSLVKKYPPDRNPHHFQQIKEAYEQIKTHKKRLQYYLFDTTLADRDDLIATLLPDEKLKRPDLQIVKCILKK